MGMYTVGIEASAKRLRSISKNAPNALDDVGYAFGVYLGRQVYKQFRTNGAWFGTPWRPLTPEYAARKTAEGYGGQPILVKTGELRREFRFPKNIIRHTSKRWVYGTDSDLAAWHHYGTYRDGKQVNPPRPIIVVTPLMEKQLARLIKNAILGKGLEVDE